MRQWFLGVALVLLSVLVWWKVVYAPWQEERDNVAEQVSLEAKKRDRLEKKLNRIFERKQSPQERQETLARFSGLVVQGSSMDEVSAKTQLWVQEFLESHDLSLNAYKGLSPSKWREYPLSRVQFQLRATTQGLSDLLESLENMEKAVRIEKFVVNYRRSKEHDLHVSLQLGTLFVEGLKE